MSRTAAKRAVLASLGHQPDFSALPALPMLENTIGQSLLRWLDQSGLALVFLRRLQKYNATDQISTAWRQALEARQSRNVTRTEDMFQELNRLHNAFSSFGVRAACLKGFSLVPDFCEDRFARHQVDFDFLVSPDEVHPAGEALRSCGYTAPLINESSETCFITPLRHIPSSKDDVYAVQRHRQVDLHVAIWEPCAWFAVDAPQDCLHLAQPHRTDAGDFLGLSLEDKFLLQVLHAFRHCFRSWIRLSWLFEIAYCLETHAENQALWNRVIQRSAGGPLNNAIYAFVLGLVKRLFGTSIPDPLNTWQGKRLTPPLQAWLANFALDWAISDWPGSLNNLFLAAEFIPQRTDRMKYWQSRLFPGKTQISLGSVATPTVTRYLQLQTARVSYVARRAAAHLGEVAGLPWKQLRWWRMLAASRGSNLDANCRTAD
jgi:hypothetical protein